MRSFLSKPMSRLLRLCLCGTALVLLAEAASAQPVRTLVIQDGKVTLDGRELSAEHVPASLTGLPVEIRFQFSGTAEPALAIGGRLYRIVGDRVEEVPSVGTALRSPRVELATAAGRAPRFANTVEAPVEAVAADIVTLTMPGRHAAVPVPGQEILEEQAMALNQIVADLEAQSLQGYPVDLSVEAGALSPAPSVRRFARDEPGRFERAILAERLRYQTERINQIVEELPRIEFRSYLDQVQREDLALYERLLREQRLEEESLVLATEVRALPDGPERRAREAGLREKLEQIFALKQENRHGEIVQLKAKLTELQERLDERKRLHQQIIENRMRELTGVREEASDDQP